MHPVPQCRSDPRPGAATQPRGLTLRRAPCSYFLLPSRFQSWSFSSLQCCLCLSVTGPRRPPQEPRPQRRWRCLCREAQRRHGHRAGCVLWHPHPPTGLPSHTRGARRRTSCRKRAESTPGVCRWKPAPPALRGCEEHSSHPEEGDGSPSDAREGQPPRGDTAEHGPLCARPTSMARMGAHR